MDLDILGPLVPLLAAAGGAVTGIKFVSEGERAIMLRFEKAIMRNGEYLVIHPGLRVMVPGMHKLARTHVRQRTINLPPQTIMLSDSTVFKVSAVVLCRVKDTPQDLYNALFETANLNQSLTDYGLLVVREVLESRGYQDLIGEAREQIVAELQSEMRLKADEWGVELLQFELSDCEPHEETAKLIQVRAQAKFKLEALNEAAKLLGKSSAAQIHPGLAAVLVGAPLVASAAVQVDNQFYDEEDYDPDGS